MKTTDTTISTMNQNPPKALGMPFGIKIGLIIFAFIMVAVGSAQFWYKRGITFNPTTEIAPAPAEKILIHKGEVMTAKCKDFNNIGLYAESDMTASDYSTTLRAVATIPSSILVVPTQELTYKSTKSKMKVYKCQVMKGTLMGKVVVISKNPM